MSRDSKHYGTMIDDVYFTFQQINKRKRVLLQKYPHDTPAQTKRNRHTYARISLSSRKCCPVCFRLQRSFD